MLKASEWSELLANKNNAYKILVDIKKTPLMTESFLLPEEFYTSIPNIK